MIKTPRLNSRGYQPEIAFHERAAAAACFVAFGLLAASAIPLVAQEPSGLTAADSPAAPEPPGDAAVGSPPALRLREGTQLTNRLGHFKQTGETVSFVDEEGRVLGGLPNLNLERIIRMLKSVEEPEAVSWSVSGAVTEFAGRNHLLVSRAVYKAATLPPVPDRLGE